MFNIKCRTEYSFRTAYGQVEKILAAGAKGIADRNGTWGHVNFAKAAKKLGIKPVFGVELAIVDDMTVKEKQPYNYMSFFARTDAGLKAIYELTTLATENFYYIPRIDYGVLFDLPSDVAVFSGYLPQLGSLPTNRRDSIFIELSPMSTKKLQDWATGKNFRTIASSDNFYPKITDKEVYEVVAGKDRETRTKAMHLLQDWELREEIPWIQDEAFKNAEELYNECNAKLPKGQMVKYNVEKTLEQMCIEGAIYRKVDLNNQIYSARLKRELDLIKEKQFEDYFYVIADMIVYAKQHMLVGPARGSSCGSLVCYLIGITDIDPIVHDLLFERFIDITREDLPDIDIDFQDERRELVFDYLRKKYGGENVARLGTVSRYKAKSTIGDVAKELGIPAYEVKDIKEAIIERSGGDARAAFCILDTFNTLDIGKTTLERFPQLAVAAEIENHARHNGQHAAGICVTQYPITNYCSVDKRTGAAQIDKKDAEDLNLLKIDALGLRTLTVLQDVLDQVGKTREWLLEQPLDDDKAFSVIRNERYSGIFQFEGFALQNICRQMSISSFEDIAVITALARPGPLTSGGTTEFIKRRTGSKSVEYLHSMTEQMTKVTYGVVVYQEQVMQIAREVGKMSWEDVSSLRKAMSKSLGKEFFDKYWEKFKKGALENGLKEHEAKVIWENINTMGSWAFNRSHAIAYGLVSYWCCLLKSRYPLQFAVACLRHARAEDSTITFLRELTKEGYKYKIFDKHKSQRNWEVVGDKIIGGLINVKGIGEKMAADIINRREKKIDLTARQENLLNNPITPYDRIFECKEKFKEIWDNPADHNIHTPLYCIDEISADRDGQYTFFGRLRTKNLRDLNEAIFVQKRGGRKETKHLNLLNLVVEDDTGNIRCTIDRYKYEKWGKPIIEQGKIDDWYIFKGKVRKGWLCVNVEKWRKLT